MFEKLTNFIDDRSVEIIKVRMYLDNNISIISNSCDSKNVLLGKIINGILSEKDGREVYLLTKNKEDLNFVSDRVKANIQNTNEALKVLKGICNRNENNKTIVINNLEKFINENEEFADEIIKLLRLGRANNINIIAVMKEEHKIINSNTELKSINVGDGRFSSIYE